MKKAVEELPFFLVLPIPYVLGRIYESNCLRDRIFLVSFLVELGAFSSFLGDSSGYNMLPSEVNLVFLGPSLNFESGSCKIGSGFANTEVFYLVSPCLAYAPPPLLSEVAAVSICYCYFIMMKGSMPYCSISI
jgi:hypothetical protein